MEIQKTNNIPDEDIQALSWFANACYTKGCTPIYFSDVWTMRRLFHSI